MSGPALRKLVIVGVGLIGGSFALALKRAGAVRSVVGVGREPANLEAALSAGIVDRARAIGEAWTSEVSDADFVMLATPVGEMPSLLAAIAPALGRDTVVTDVGSTKQDVVAAARKHLAANLPNFVPAHPIAGTERSGARAAFAELFRGRTVVLTPIAETAAAALARVSDCWACCGGIVRHLEATRHDAILGAVSHLPHVLAYALVAGIAARPDGVECLEYAGTGFRDATRLAGSQPRMWRDVCIANRAELLRELATYRHELERIEELLVQSDGEGLQRLFERARAAREGWLRGRGEADEA